MCKQVNNHDAILVCMLGTHFVAGLMSDLNNVSTNAQGLGLKVGFDL